MLTVKAMTIGGTESRAKATASCVVGSTAFGTSARSRTAPNAKDRKVLLSSVARSVRSLIASRSICVAVRFSVRMCELGPIGTAYRSMYTVLVLSKELWRESRVAVKEEKSTVSSNVSDSRSEVRLRVKLLKMGAEESAV